MISWEFSYILSCPGGAIVLLILASFLPEKPAITNGLICCGLLVVGLIYSYARKKDLRCHCGAPEAH